MTPCSPLSSAFFKTHVKTPGFVSISLLCVQRAVSLHTSTPFHLLHFTAQVSHHLCPTVWIHKATDPNPASKISGCNNVTVSDSFFQNHSFIPALVPHLKIAIPFIYQWDWIQIYTGQKEPIYSCMWAFLSSQENIGHLTYIVSLCCQYCLYHHHHWLPCPYTSS